MSDVLLRGRGDPSPDALRAPLPGLTLRPEVSA